MRQTITLIAALLIASNALASIKNTREQRTDISNAYTNTEYADSIFCQYLVNDEYQVWLKIDFYNNKITVPDQEEIFGEVAGVFGAVRDTRKWIVTDAEVKANIATLTIINDYGSEDLTATLRHNADGTYTLTRIEGSTMRIVVNNKWVKLPKELVFKIKK